ncbi:hypothetical protein ACIBCT_06630 [Streptosporangium sp. NPDC050855]
METVFGFSDQRAEQGVAPALKAAMDGFALAAVHMVFRTISGG